MSENDIVLRPFEAGDLEWLVDEHARLYAQDEGFDDTFGPLVRDILQDYLQSHDPECESSWIAERAGARLGSVFCVRGPKSEQAKLRLFLVLPEARGLGLGRKLLSTCMAFARDKGYRGMRLWTHESHRAACALYAGHGWKVTSSKPVRSFGVDLVEQTWEIAF
ncbi:N-acetyltransferase family protein [Shimia sp. W99]